MIEMKSENLFERERMSVSHAVAFQNGCYAFTLKIGDSLTLYNCRLVKNKEGKYFITSERQKGKDGKYYAHFHLNMPDAVLEDIVKVVKLNAR